MVKKILQHRTVSLLSLLSLCLTLGGALWAWLSLAGINTPIYIIHFNDMNGITEVGGLGNIIAIGFFGLIIAIANAFIAYELEEKDPFLGKLLAGTGVVVSILLFMAFAAILNVN